MANRLARQAAERARTPAAEIERQRREIERQRADLERIDRERERAQRERDRLRRERDRLRQKIDRLEDELDAARRAGFRQAAPFSKGAPTPAPRRPGRRPGAAYGTKAHRAVPRQINESYEAPLPAGVNTKDVEVCPVVSPDGRHLFFMRAGRVFWVDAAVIEDARTGAATGDR